MVEVPDEIELTDPQTRVLGCLLEKQMTTPDVYPLTLKALTTACNQSSNRDPVVDYEPTLVETTVQALKGKGLARVVHPVAGERATKYRQVANEALDLDTARAALLCMLLLRGPQTVNELRTRTERMHHFGSVDDVERTLEEMTEGPRPLVTRVERGAGRKEPRWVQLLQADAERRIDDALTATATGAGSGGSRSTRIDELEARVAALEERIAQLVAGLDGLVELPDQDTSSQSSL